MSVWVSTFLAQSRAEGSAERGLEIKVHAALVVERGGAQICRITARASETEIFRASMPVCMCACMHGWTYGVWMCADIRTPRNSKSSQFSFKSGFP